MKSKKVFPWQLRAWSRKCSQPMMTWFALGMVIFLSLTVGVALPRPLLAQAEGQAEQAAIEATVEVVMEAPTQVAAGQLIQVSLRLNSPSLIHAAEAQWLYQPSALEFAGFNLTAPDSTPATGRLILPLLPTGAAVGFYTCATSPCVEVYSAPAQTAEMSARETVLTVELLPLTRGRVEINLAGLQVVDSLGRSLPLNLAQTTLTVQVGDVTDAIPAPAAPWEAVASTASAEAVTAAAADVASDGTLDHADLMEVALGWQIVREGSGPCGGAEAQADVNGDGCVDVVDVQLAAVFTGAGDVPVDAASAPAIEADPAAGSETGVPADAAQTFLPNLVIPGEDTGTSAANDAAIAPAATAQVFVVDGIGDRNDGNLGDGTCATLDEVCTLRAAIDEANRREGPDTIRFAIPAELASPAGVFTIQLADRLPSLNDTAGGTTIDGYTQAGAAPNDDPVVSNAQIRIEIRGDGFNNFDGLYITSAENTVRGLSFYNLRRSIGIYGSGASDNFIAGNFIGTDAAGNFGATETANEDAQAHGVHVEQGAARNRIGSPDVADRNIISGNARHGIGFWHTGTRDNVVYNNIVGLSPAGTDRLSNRVHGIDINYGASFNVIGGVGPGQRNVLSGNGGTGAEITHQADTTQNRIVGNYIGTDVSGNGAATFSNNGGTGVSVHDRVTSNFVLSNTIGNNVDGGIFVNNFGTCCVTNTVIAGNRIGIGVDGAVLGNGLFGVRLYSPNTTLGPGNIIAFNPLGVQVDQISVTVGTGDHISNTITRNSIYNNAGLGIDLQPVGEVNPNDANDADAGANRGLNFPVLAEATRESAIGTACAGCIVEIFIADVQAVQYGEGKTFVGTATADASGDFTVSLTGVNFGDYLTSTATDAEGNTSEFSLNLLVANPANQPPTAADDAATTSEGTPVTINVLANDSDPEDDMLTVVEVGAAANGTVTPNGLLVTYTPEADFVGEDSFTYTVSDNIGGNASATVIITVNADGATGTPGVIVSPVAFTVSEGSPPRSYSIKLASEPSADVVINLAVGDQLDATPAALTFTTDNWNIPQAVFVTTIDDQRIEGRHQGVIQHNLMSTDANYNSIGADSVVFTINDNDFAGGGGGEDDDDDDDDGTDDSTGDLFLPLVITTP